MKYMLYFLIPKISEVFSGSGDFPDIEEIYFLRKEKVDTVKIASTIKDIMKSISKNF
jgi:hypothetical protein